MTLQQLQRDMASRNKEAIANYFHFPVSNDSIQLLNTNPAIGKQVEQSNHFITRSLFFTHFDVIYDN